MKLMDAYSSLIILKPLTLISVMSIYFELKFNDLF